MPTAPSVPVAGVYTLHCQLDVYLVDGFGVGGRGHLAAIRGRVHPRGVLDHQGCPAQDLCPGHKVP